jgi:ADP-heptose:LPS heptosyltransferase
VVNKNGAIYIAIIGSGSQNIGEMIALSTAIRILHQELKKLHFFDIKIDMYVNASGNAYYKRDKQFFKSFPYIHAIKPLSISTKQLSFYDYYIDLSSVEKSIVYDEIPYVDFYLRQFGINYTKISNNMKHNMLFLKNYKPSQNLQKKIQEAKKEHSLLLFHPYSASIKRSIPIEISKKILEKLTTTSTQYKIVTALSIEGVKNKEFLDFSNESKSLFDFMYIISQMDAMITVDTASYHIADAFFIPTVVLFTQEQLIEKRLLYYSFCKPMSIKPKSKNYSQFIFQNSALHITNYGSWEKLKIKKVMKLLDKIG